MPRTTSEPMVPLHDGKLSPAPREVGGATFTIGTEASEVINVAIQLNDLGGREITWSAGILAYLSDNSDGSTVGTAHSTSPAIGTDGLMQDLVADLVFLLTSESDGDIDIDFTDSGAQTVYLVLVMPSGRLVISDAITHAA